MLMKETEELLGRFDVGTFIPWLAWINTVSGFNARVNEVAKENDEFFERILEERMKDGRVEEEEDFLDVLLGIDKDAVGGFDIDRDSIKALILVNSLKPFCLSRDLNSDPFWNLDFM